MQFEHAKFTVSHRLCLCRPGFFCYSGPYVWPCPCFCLNFDLGPSPSNLKKYIKNKKNKKTYRVSDYGFRVLLLFTLCVIGHLSSFAGNHSIHCDCSKDGKLEWSVAWTHSGRSHLRTSVEVTGSNWEGPQWPAATFVSLWKRELLHLFCFVLWLSCDQLKVPWLRVQNFVILEA